MLNFTDINSRLVNVLIGPNGSGKSRMLRDLSIDSLAIGKRVIAIAPSIHDRFRGIKKRQFRFFGARQGRGSVTKLVQNALIRASYEDPVVLKHLTMALAYTGFDAVVGFKIKYLDVEKIYQLQDEFEPAEFERLRGALLKFRSSTSSRSDGVRQLTLDNFSFTELDSLLVGTVAKHESILKKHKVVNQIDYFLFRKNERIPLMEACSGELCFIATVAFIATEIEPNTLIVIDEPETSLHPTWQKNYIETLLDLFSYYSPRITISTHSPIIISGTKADQVAVYEVKDGFAKAFSYEKLSLEEMYHYLFGIITPKNHHLSTVAVTLLNDLNAGNIQLPAVINALSDLSEKSYDDQQRKVISKIGHLAEKITVKQQTGAR